MIQSIYAEVSNGNQVSCGRRHPKYKALPIPLMKENYLGEFRTQLEKAKARKNLGIGDEYSLTWGNITGHIEDNEALMRFIEQQWKYDYISPYIQLEIHNVKEALDYALYYVSTFEANDQAVQELNNKFDNLDLYIRELNNTLSSNIETNANSILGLQGSIGVINQLISDINSALQHINVDDNIRDWVKDNLEQSSTIYFKDIERQKIDNDGNPMYNENDEPIMEVIFQVMEIRISKEDNNSIEIKQDGLYVKSYDLSIQSIISDIQELQQQQGEISQSLSGLKYVTTLPDSTTSPVHEGVTVQQLKNKSMSEILDEVLFPAEVRDLVEPTISYSDIIDLVEKGTPIVYPEVEYLAGDAGETIAQTNTLMLNNSSYEGDYYDLVGTYIFSAIVQYDAGEYLRNNRGEVTTSRIEAGAVSVTKSVKVTYPWYAGDETGVTKQQLVPIGQPSGVIDFSLTRHAVVKIPGANSSLTSFRLDSGLGYLDVDISGWTQTTEQINGITYKVYTKIDEYVAILPHRINFTINI